MAPKHKILLFIFLIFTIGCSNSSEIEWDEIKEIRSVDAAQELIIDNPNSKFFDEIIDSLRVFWKEDPRIWSGDRITLNINLKSTETVYVNGQIIDIDSIPIITFEFIANPNQRNDFATTTPLVIQGFEDYRLFRYVFTIVIRSEKGYSVSEYRSVLHKVIEGIMKIRKDYSKALFHNKYKRLKDDERNVIDKMIPLNIWIEKYEPGINEVPPKGMPVII